MKALVHIIFLCTLSAIGYGLIHDQITARVCQEYFTLGHRTPEFVPRNPAALGLFWGVAATWWAGFLIGVPLACAARLGKLPTVAPKDLVRPVLTLLLSMLGIAMLGLALTLFAGLAGVVPKSWLAAVPEGVPGERVVRFVADAVAHNLSYAVGFFGGVRLWTSTLLTRRRLQRTQTAIESPLA